METNFTPKTVAELGIRLTSIEDSYWNNKGAYQAEGDKLFKEMVPASGAAETLNGELIRGINCLTDEYLNNGNCDAAIVTRVGDHGWWDEEEEDPDEIESVEIDAYYDKFLELIRETLSEKIVSREVNAVMDKIEEIIEDAAYDQPCSVYFSKERVNAYSRMTDMVIWYVLNTEDTELPSNYDRN